MHSRQDGEDVYMNENDDVQFRRRPVPPGTQTSNSTKVQTLTLAGHDEDISKKKDRFKVIISVVVAIFVVVMLALFGVQANWVFGNSNRNIELKKEIESAMMTSESNHLDIIQEIKDQLLNLTKTSERYHIALEESMETLRRNLTDVVTACPQTSYFFPNIEGTTNYIRVTTPIPELDKFTVCGLFKRSTNTFDTWVSYATSNDDNLYLMEYSSDQIYITMNRHSYREGLKLNASTENHICVTTSASEGRSNVYLDGERVDVWTTRSGTLDGSGSFIIGQDQDQIGGGFQSRQSFQGTLRNFMLWRRALEEHEIREMYQNRCVCPEDYHFTLERDNIEIFGGVTAVWPIEC